LVYLGSCISACGGVSDEVSPCIVTARAAYVNLDHLWRLRDVSLAVKGRIYNASVRADLFYTCETWPLRVEDVRQLSVFDHCCLRRIAGIQWQHHVSNAEVRYRVFGYRDNSIGINWYLETSTPVAWLCSTNVVLENPTSCIICQNWDWLEKSREVVSV
ncbi:hypothetical protein MS3_00000181, partial [Schistosoma haematobium]